MKIEVSSYTAIIKCPHCDANVTGWLDDPRGAENVECDECGKTFDVSNDCEVVLT